MQVQCAVEYTAVAGIFAVCQVTSIKFRKNALASQCIFLLCVPYIYKFVSLQGSILNSSYLVETCF